MKKAIGTIVVLLMILATFTASAATIIDEGFVGIVLHHGQMQDDLLYPGKHRLGFLGIGYDVIKMDCRWQNYSIQTSAFSKDIQQVDLIVSVNYQLQKQGAQRMYRDVGEDYADKIIKPRMLDALKSVISKYSAEELIAKRQEISYQVLDLIKAQLEFYELNIREIAIEDIDFTDAYTDAIEAKQVATQRSLQIKTEQEQLTLETEAEAERKKIEAQNALEIAKLEADAIVYTAEKQAEANKKLAESMTNELLDYYRIEKWDGKLPKISGGESMITLIDGTKETAEQQ